MSDESAPGSAPWAARLHDLQHALEQAPALLGRLLVRHPRAAFERRPAEGTWSARENLAHLGLYHVAFMERVEAILQQENPRFPRYRAEDDGRWEEWRALPLAEAVRRFEEGRSDLTDRLVWLKPEQVWRTGTHPLFGTMDILDWVDLFLAHEGHHFYTIMIRLGGA